MGQKGFSAVPNLPLCLLVLRFSPGDAAHSGQKAKQILSESAPVFPLIVLAGWRACFQK